MVTVKSFWPTRDVFRFHHLSHFLANVRQQHILSFIALNQAKLHKRRSSRTHLFQVCALTVWSAFYDANAKRHAYLWAESAHAADDLVRAAQIRVPIGGHCRDAGSHTHCSPLGPHLPSPSAEEPGVAQLLDRWLKSLKKNRSRLTHKTLQTLEYI